MLFLCVDVLIGYKCKMGYWEDNMLKHDSVELREN